MPRRRRPRGSASGQGHSLALQPRRGGEHRAVPREWGMTHETCGTSTTWFSVRNAFGTRSNRAESGAPAAFDQHLPHDECQLLAMLRQESAQTRMAWEHFFICSSSPKRSQESAQRSQTSAHAPQMILWTAESRSMKLALVWQISAQSISSRMCSGRHGGHPSQGSTPPSPRRSDDTSRIHRCRHACRDR